MKKVIVLIAALAVFSAAAFADVALKKLDSGKVEVTFTFSHPTAKNVRIAGNFTDWQSGAKTMKKEGDVFTYTKVVSPKTVMEYKFIVDGVWTTDRNAPGKKDDGFGGNNGVVDVNALIGE